MCGIAGLLSFENPGVAEATRVLARMSGALASRGPDASGLWIGPTNDIAFAHRRLSIIDVDARSNQPMHSADGRYTIVFNGEIYNYQELRADLTAKGRLFRTTSDTEVLLEMYAEYGSEMLSRLRGMYAFGLWDEVAGELFLARDPFGIKPLYYANAGGVLYFASQVRAFRTVPGVDLREEAAGHVGFFVWGSVPEPYTLYRGIHCLPSGSWMRATRQGTSSVRVFATPVQEALGFDPAAMPRSQGETDARLHEALKESLRMHEIADVPVAIFLSAGIDSGMIAALAAEAGNKVETLTLGFDRLRNTPNDETPLAARVAQHYGLPHHADSIDQSAFLQHREHLLEEMDQPTIDGVNTYFISWLAHQYGYKVALSGLGGDELFGGYPGFRQIPRMVQALRAGNAAPWLGCGLRVVLHPMISRLTSPKYASLLEYGGTWGGAYLLRRGLFMPWELPDFLDPELVRTGWRDLGSLESMKAMVRPFLNLRNVAAKQVSFLRVSALEMSHYMRTQLLRDADWAGMAHSVEIRVPLVDMTLLRQVSPLRASRFSPRKPEIVRCLQTPLPDAILKRPKTGFNVPVREWMQESAEAGSFTSGGLQGRAAERGLRQWAIHVHQALLRRNAGAPHGIEDSSAPALAAGSSSPRVL